MKDKGQRRLLKWAFAFGCWTVFGLFFASQEIVRYRYAGRVVEWRLMLTVWLASAYIWAALTPLILYLARRFPIERNRWPRSLLFHLAASVIFSGLELLVFMLIVPLLGLPPRPGSFSERLLTIFVVDFHFNLLTYWGILGVSLALDYYRKYQERALRASQLKNQLAEAQLDALRMQLHPHFLFNTLNAIVVLVRKSSNEEAVRMLTGLSELLRHALENISAQEVLLKDEIEFLERYLEIEQVRYNDRLKVEMKIDKETLGALVPNLILQPLVENAIRHGIGKRSTAGRVEVSARRENGRLHLQVRDDGPGLPAEWSQANGKGIGLRNTRARLEQLYGKAQEFQLSNAEGGGTIATLLIPFQSERDKPEVGRQDNGEDSDADS
ncbi:MAG: two-component system, LytTR family, sensor kinase [Acidobacteriota bacterium]|jgi:two-component sensor histidine kinase|nr:two-component system, LytTR family, sensor kinase [Acidobacteriota bacterium]